MVQWRDVKAQNSAEFIMVHWSDVKAQTFATPQLGKVLVRKPLVLELLGPLQGKRLLEVGCGNGYWCREFARLGACVTGVETADEQLKRAVAEETQRPLGIRYLKRDGSRLTELGEGVFDHVFLDYVLLEVAQLETLKGIFVEAHRVLRAGGQLLVSDLHPFDTMLDDQIVLPPGFDYFKRGAAFTARGRQIDGTAIEFTDYHWTVSDYFEAMTGAGFRLTRLLEPEANRHILQAHPELRYRAHPFLCSSCRPCFWPRWCATGGHRSGRSSLPARNLSWRRAFCPPRPIP